MRKMEHFMFCRYTFLLHNSVFRNKFKAHFIFDGANIFNCVFFTLICYLVHLKHSCLKIALLFPENM